MVKVVSSSKQETVPPDWLGGRTVEFRPWAVPAWAKLLSRHRMVAWFDLCCARDPGERRLDVARCIE